MITAKANYKNKHQNLICRRGVHEEETQQHTLEKCPKIHKTKESIITTQDIFSTDLKTNIATANNLIKINTELKTWNKT